MSETANPGITRLLVTPRWEGERLDLFLAGTTELSRRGARRLVADGLVRRNAEALRVQSRILETGDIIDVLRSREELGCPREPALETPTILHDDRWLLVAAKPAGVLSQPTDRGPREESSFDQQVLLALALSEGRRPFLRMVHRLDRMTSGAVLFARRANTLPALSRAWTDGRVERLYLAVVEGRPSFDATEIDLPIARDYGHTWRFHTAPGGKPARTEVRVSARLEENLTVVFCRLITGRTHQVRIHLASIGHPVLGDRLYGSMRPGDAGRPLLHAASLALPHPASGDPLRVICPPPEDIRQYLPEGSDLIATPKWTG